ncbi:hypothetical protein Taro_055899 [Colocasia esculenta]|uniref:Uncharacterized protein n=1 Tax=Colocasia esculenta TaxID=4460 RepID=A0A843XUW6_COLES|nr:hypothetical protein [Colocasia esculenta]
MASDRREWPTPYFCPASDSRNRGRSSAGIAILECETKIFRPRNDASRAVPIAGRTNICILPKGYDNRCTSTHAPGRNFDPETEFHETSALSTVSECRFRSVVT